MQTTEQSVAAVFMAMISLYTEQRFYKKWPEASLPTVTKTWAAQLRGFSPETIARAAEAMPDVYVDYIPDLPQFKALCRQYNRPEHQEIPALPMPTVSKEQARQNIAKVREMMKGVVKTFNQEGVNQ